MKKVLLVEDDEILRRNYDMLLSAHRLDVRTCSSKSEAMAAFASDSFDMAILDVTLGSDYEAGFELCQHFRASNAKIPIVFLTERDEDTDRISGLRLGADDYLTKTISGTYLVARINALIRRFETLVSQQKDAPIEKISKSGLRIDENLSCAYWDNTLLRLSLTQFWILKDLWYHQGQARSVSELMRAASITVQPNTIVAHIKAIRDEIQRYHPTFASIKSERARGYRWIDE